MFKNVADLIIGVLEWLYRRNTPFTVLEMLKTLHIDLSEKNIEFALKFIEYNSLVFKPVDSTSLFTPKHAGENDVLVPKGSFFNGKSFSVMPTKLELEKGIFIPGSRFYPYTNPFLKFGAPHLKYAGKDLEVENILLPVNEIKEYYFLCNDNLLFSMLATRKENSKIVSYPAPPSTKSFFIPCYDLKKYYKKNSFAEKDQIVFEIDAWGYASVSLKNKKMSVATQEYQMLWESEFFHKLPKAIENSIPENPLLDSIFSDMFYLGQETFFQENNFVPLDSFLKERNYIESVQFSSGSELWFKGEKMLPPGNYFSYLYDLAHLLTILNETDAFFCNLSLPITDSVVESFVYRFLDENYIKVNENPQEYREKCFKSFTDTFLKNEKYRKYDEEVMSIIEDKFQHCVDTYDPFKNKELMGYSFDTLDMFIKTLFLVNESYKNPCDLDMRHDFFFMIRKLVKDIISILLAFSDLLNKKDIKDRQELQNTTMETYKNVKNFFTLIDHLARFRF